ncbi:hypothetical protein DPSP01_004541 [Paraphaeosphaeria sporulosa]
METLVFLSMATNTDTVVLFVVGTLAATFLLYSSGLVIFRLCFSPLSQFPGPKLAAATAWYETLVDITSNNFHEILMDMHKQYGPIIRCSPWEISINDAEYYTKLYVPAGIRHTNSMVQRFGFGLESESLYSAVIPSSVLNHKDTIATTSDHDLHQLRRRPLEKYLSRQGIMQVEAVIHEKTRLLDERLSAMRGTGSVVRLDQAYSAYLGDITIELTVGESSRMLEEADFAPEWHNIIRSILLVNPVIRNFPFLGKLLKMIPMGLIRSAYPRIAAFKMWDVLGRDKVDNIKSDLAEEVVPQKFSFFHTLIRSDLPAFEKHASRLSAEAVGVFGGGTINPTSALAFMTFHILNDAQIHRRLQESLTEIMNEFPQKSPTWIELEQVPYLAACVKEGLRMSCQFRRSARVAPHTELHYKEWVIPKNTAVAMAIYNMHYDSDVFPDPFAFKPGRWLGDIDPRMNRHFAPWGKGSRDCPGKNLASAEMYVCLGTLFRPGGPFSAQVALKDCDETDFALLRESEFGVFPYSSRGLGVSFD